MTQTHRELLLWWGLLPALSERLVDDFTPVCHLQKYASREEGARPCHKPLLQALLTTVPCIREWNTKRAKPPSDCPGSTFSREPSQTIPACSETLFLDPTLPSHDGSHILVLCYLLFNIRGQTLVTGDLGSHPGSLTY